MCEYTWIHVYIYIYTYEYIIYIQRPKDPSMRCKVQHNDKPIATQSSHFCTWNWLNSGFRPLATSYGCLQCRVETRRESCGNRSVRFGLAETYLQHGSVTTAKDVEVHIQYCVYTCFVNSSSSSSYQPVPSHTTLVMPKQIDESIKHQALIDVQPFHLRENAKIERRCFFRVVCMGKT